MLLSRRRFLGYAATITATAGLRPWELARALAEEGTDPSTAASLTTLATRYGPGAPGLLGYRQVVTLPGEPHVVRTDLATAAVDRAGRRVSLLAFAHLTDQHIVDSESTARVEFLDRHNDGHCGAMPFSSAHRPQETASARIADAMNRRLRAISVSPVTGAPIAAAICTGDNTDNQQTNELDLFLGLMDGGPVTPGSGDTGRYEGVQASGDRHYWHPAPAVADLYKTRFGFPSIPGFLDDALAPFVAAGVGFPWYTCFGNHDALVQGNAPANVVFDRIAQGGVKVVGAPAGLNPCDELAGIGGGPGAVVMPTTADLERRFASKRAWIEAHLASTTAPLGHGFTADNVADVTGYYATDVAGIRFIVLDTVNPGGYADGSIGDKQLQWLREELTAAQAAQKLTILFSHHGLRSLNNPLQAADPLQPEANDLPRHTAETVEPLVAEFSCVIAWVNGHSHTNVIQARHGFWDIGTAAHIDWPLQSRLVEVVDNRDGTLSIFGTMVDHEDDAVTILARELAGNDPHGGFATGNGTPADRNVELLLPHPFA